MVGYEYQRPVVGQAGKVFELDACTGQIKPESKGKIKPVDRHFVRLFAKDVECDDLYDMKN
ncbi:hypothetical protein D3C87_2096260 [compost metagenome]